MASRTRVVCCVGTRPEAIKMAPVIAAFKQAAWAETIVLATAQHRGMLDQMLACFGIRADVDLNAMRENQTITELAGRLLVSLDKAMDELKPGLVLAQGDTTTVLTTALASFWRRIPFAHVEAGLRTHDLGSPFPEEANRVLAGHVTSLHLAPTARARENLVQEAIRPGAIQVVGNTVIDALLETARRDVPLSVDLDPAKRLVLVTAHRRDAHGEPIRQICDAVLELVRRFNDIEVVWPVHPSPAIRAVVENAVRGVPRIHLVESLPYGEFVSVMKRAALVLTDSGGIQEEAPALKKPVLVMRDGSERPEALEAGVAMLVGTDAGRIVENAARLLTDPIAYGAMARGGSPYGDGHAAGRIVRACERFLAQQPMDDMDTFRPVRDAGDVAGSTPPVVNARRGEALGARRDR